MTTVEDYEIVGCIGKGSFGIVNKIRRKSDGCLLVWKEIDFSSMSDSEKNLLVSEVNILRELKHPHIVRYYDRIIDSHKSKIYIVMEYLERGDLAQKIKRRRKSGIYIKEEWIWSVLAQLILALKGCHRHHAFKNDTLEPILHRDIKPANVLINSENHVKLGDFGFAKVLSSSRKYAKTYVGTPFYMSPELILEEKYDERADIWSLGCLIYELAALRPPFQAENEVELAKKIQEGRFRRLPPQYSDDLYGVIRFMLRTSISDRARIEDLEVLEPIQRHMKEFIPVIKESELHRESKRYLTLMNELNKREQVLQQQEMNLTAKENALVARETLLNLKEKI